MPVSRRSRPAVTHGVVNTAVAAPMYSDPMWPRLESALARAQAGDGDGLLALHDSYFGIVDGASIGNEIEAYLAINCLDDPGATGPEALFAHESEFARAALAVDRYLVDLFAPVDEMRCP